MTNPGGQYSYDQAAPATSPVYDLRPAEPSHTVMTPDGKLYYAVPRNPNAGQSQPSDSAQQYIQDVNYAESPRSNGRMGRVCRRLARVAIPFAIGGTVAGTLTGVLLSGHASTNFKEDLKVAKTIPSFVLDEYSWAIDKVTK